MQQTIGSQTKKVANPLVGSLVDFQTELQAQFPEQTWAPGLLQAAARAKLNARHWPEVVAVSAEAIAQGDLVLLGRMLGKLWPFKAPEWVCSLREKAADIKQQKKAAEAVAAEGATGANDKAAGGLQEEADKAAEGAEVAAAAAGAPGPSADAPAASAGTPGQPAPAPGKPAVPGKPAAASRAPGLFFVGDVVKLSDSLGRKFGGQEAVVVKVFLRQRGLAKKSTTKIGHEGGYLDPDLILSVPVPEKF